MRRALFSAIVVLVLLGGCGGANSPSASDKASQAAEKRAEKAEKAAEARQEAAAERRARQSAVYTECRSVVGPLDTKLTDLNSRLSVGLPFAKYSDQVGSAKVAYDKLIRDAKARGGSATNASIGSAHRWSRH